MGQPAKGTPSDPVPNLSELSEEALVRVLLDRKSSVRAYREICRRQERPAVWRSEGPLAHVLPWLQGNGRAPIGLVLLWLALDSDDEGDYRDYEVPDPHELFPVDVGQRPRDAPYRGEKVDSRERPFLPSRRERALDHYLTGNTGASIRRDLSSPYRYRSLRDLPNDQIVRYMGRGRSVLDLEQEVVIPTAIPEDTWRVSPREAALAIAEANRTPWHRGHFRLAVDGRGGQQPPEESDVLLFRLWTKESQTEWSYFLRVGANKSYLAFTLSDEPDADPGGNFLRAQPVYALECFELDYARARQAAHTIWGLNRARSWPTVETIKWQHGAWWPGGGVLLQFVDRGGEARFTLRSSGAFEPQVAERWDGDYDRDVCLRLIAHLMTMAHTGSSAKGGSRRRLRYPHDLLGWHSDARRYGSDDMEHLRSVAAQLLDLAAEEPAQLPAHMALQTIRTAGHFAFSELTAELMRVGARLGRSDIRPRFSPATGEGAAREGHRDGPGTSTVAVVREQSTQKLRKERRESDPTGSRARWDLRKTVRLALRKIDAARNADVLYSWAASRDAGFLWAIQRLKAEEPTRYLGALEWHFRHVSGNMRRWSLDAIAEADQQKATRLIRELKPQQRAALLSAVEKAEEIPDEARRIEALVQVMCHPETIGDFKSALRRLVPPDDPMRHPSREIDRALLAQSQVEGLIAHRHIEAQRALAMRTGAAHFADIVANLTRTDAYAYGHQAGILAYMVQKGGRAHQVRLTEILRTKLRRVPPYVNDVLWATWAADLRDLQSEVERVATSDPEDVEGTRSDRSANDPAEIPDRYHLARKIAAVWNEEEPVARAKLLLAWGFHDVQHVVIPREVSRAGDSMSAADDYWSARSRRAERSVRMKAELERLANTLSAEHKRDVVAFIDWYERTHIVTEDNGCLREWRERFAGLARRMLAKP